MEKGILKRLYINEKGVAIATAMSVVLILALLGAGLLLLSMREMNISLKSESSNQAFHVAEAGVEYATNKILNGEILVDFSETKTFGGGEFVVSIDREVDYSTPQVTYTITSTGIVEDTQATETSWLPSLINKIVPVALAADNQKTLNVEMTQTKPFTEYVFFMDEKQDPDNYDFISYKQLGMSGGYVGDEVTGTVHANGNVGLDHDLSIYSVANGSPIFNGLVSYVNGINIDGGGEPVFKPPREQVGPATFPVVNNYTFLESKAGEDWIFHSDTTVTLKDNVVAINGFDKDTFPQNGIIYVDNGDVSVSGTSDGRLTIVSAGGTAGGNIKIVGNITYTNEDIEPSASASDDMLGLIAENDIVIKDSAPNDVFIDAVMLAKTGSIWYENWDGKMAGSAKGTITVNGSIIQKNDYGDILGTGKGKHFGNMYAEVKKGYLKKLNYDKRLYYLEPPYFFKPDRSLYKITWK